ncbi:MAG: hypothetical protein WAO61_00390 [Solirubrobacterales bacterium]
MARVLIVDRSGRAGAVTQALAARDFAVRTVDDDPLLPGHVVDALDAVTVVCWLMGAGAGRSLEANGEQLQTVLLKIVDTGVRGVVFERPGDAPNEHVEHARDTWHIPIAEVDADPAGGEDWLAAICSAVGETLGVTS